LILGIDPFDLDISIHDVFAEMVVFDTDVDLACSWIHFWRFDDVNAPFVIFVDFGTVGTSIANVHLCNRRNFL